MTIADIILILWGVYLVIGLFVLIRNKTLDSNPLSRYSESWLIPMGVMTILLIIWPITLKEEK